MVRVEDIERLREVYDREYTVTTNDIPVNERKCRIEVVPIIKKETDNRDNMTEDEIIDYVVRAISYDTVCDNEDYLIECMEELWGKEFMVHFKDDIKHQIINKGIDPKGQMGLKLIMF